MCMITSCSLLCEKSSHNNRCEVHSEHVQLEHLTYHRDHKNDFQVAYSLPCPGLAHLECPAFCRLHRDISSVMDVVENNCHGKVVPFLVHNNDVVDWQCYCEIGNCDYC